MILNHPNIHPHSLLNDQNPSIKNNRFYLFFFTVIHAVVPVACQEVADLIPGPHHAHEVVPFPQLGKLHAKLEKHMDDHEKMAVKMEILLTDTAKKNAMVPVVPPLPIRPHQKDVMNTIHHRPSVSLIQSAAAQSPRVDMVAEAVPRFHVRAQIPIEISNY